MTKFKIEKGVPLPARNGEPDLVELYETLSKMKVGESFAIPRSEDPEDKFQYKIVAWGRFQTVPMSFQTRRVRQGEFVRRVWRVK